MDRNEINTLNDLLNAAATALNEGDTETLEMLQSISSGWLQDDESQNAQSKLLDAMLEAAYQLDEE